MSVGVLSLLIIVLGVVVTMWIIVGFKGVLILVLSTLLAILALSWLNWVLVHFDDKIEISHLKNIFDRRGN